MLGALSWYSTETHNEARILRTLAARKGAGTASPTLVVHQQVWPRSAREPEVHRAAEHGAASKHTVCDHS
jgi:hypothetical protein